MSEQHNAINIYTCQTCGWKMITINRAEGVTPAFVSCENGCDPESFPTCISSMYRVPQTLTPTYEWYRPSDEEMKDKPHAVEHVRMGGLLLRKINT